MINEWMLKKSNKRMGFFIVVIPSLFLWMMVFLTFYIF